MLKPLLSSSELLKVKRVLVMSSVDLGGFVYHGALLKSLKRRYPHLMVDMWLDKCKFGHKSFVRESNNTLESVILKTGLIDVVFPFAKGDSERETLIRRAQHRKYDVIFFIAPKRSADFAKVARTISNKAKIIGNMPAGLTEKIKGARYLRHITKRFQLDLHNESAHVLTMLKAYYDKCFGSLTLAQEEQFGLAITLPDCAVVASNKWLSERAKSQSENREFQNTILINPISTSRSRDINGNTLKHLIQTLLGTYPNIHIIVNVPSSANVGMNALLKSFYMNKKATQLISVFDAKSDLYILVALMKQCDFTVTVQSSLMHIAATMNIPQMAIVRRKAQRWQPLRASDVFLYEDGEPDCCNYFVASRALKNYQEALEGKVCEGKAV